MREELKFFAKTNIDLKDGDNFKSIVLFNADKLTIDAQSALRRCIELFSHSTRFFIIVEDKYKLLRPVLSRFCEIFVANPVYKGRTINLHTYNLEQVFHLEKIKNARKLWLRRAIKIHPALLCKTGTTEEESGGAINGGVEDEAGNEDADLVGTAAPTIATVMQLANLLYEKAYAATDLIALIETSKMDERKKYEFLITFNRVKKEFRNEKLLMLFILNFIVLFRSDTTLENISFM